MTSFLERAGGHPLALPASACLEAPHGSNRWHDFPQTPRPPGENVKLVVFVSVIVALAAPHTWRPEQERASEVVHIVYSPQKHRVANAAKFDRHLARARAAAPPPPSPGEKRPDLGTTLHKSVEWDDESLFGVDVRLDVEHSVGWVLIRDDVPRHLIDGMFASWTVLGWFPVEDSEAIEPHEFEDGSTGVKVWLYRLERSMSAILRELRVA